METPLPGKYNPKEKNRQTKQNLILSYSMCPSKSLLSYNHGRNHRSKTQLGGVRGKTSYTSDFELFSFMVIIAKRQGHFPRNLCFVFFGLSAPAGISISEYCVPNLSSSSLLFIFHPDHKGGCHRSWGDRGRGKEKEFLLTGKAQC